MKSACWLRCEFLFFSITVFHMLFTSRVTKFLLQLHTKSSGYYNMKPSYSESYLIIYLCVCPFQYVSHPSCYISLFPSYFLVYFFLSHTLTYRLYSRLLFPLSFFPIALWFPSLLLSSLICPFDTPSTIFHSFLLIYFTFSSHFPLFSFNLFHLLFSFSTLFF